MITGAKRKRIIIIMTITVITATMAAIIYLTFPFGSGLYMNTFPLCDPTATSDASNA